MNAAESAERIDFVIKELVDEMERMNASTLQVVAEDDNGHLTHALILVRGNRETAEVLGLVGALEQEWVEEENK